MNKYSDLPMDYADATIVCAAIDTGIYLVATFDKKDFNIYRFKKTVFSHESKIDFLAQAKANGYKIILVYIHLFDSSLNEARVKQRVAEGGHSVPPVKIHSRIPRTMELIKTALSLVDEARILDNSSKDDPFQQIIVMKSGNYETKVDPLPEWAKDLLPT